jgi:hypothetical protein
MFIWSLRLAVSLFIVLSISRDYHASRAMCEIFSKKTRRGGRDALLCDIVWKTVRDYTQICLFSGAGETQAIVLVSFWCTSRVFTRRGYVQ